MQVTTNGRSSGQHLSTNVIGMENVVLIVHAILLTLPDMNVLVCQGARIFVSSVQSINDSSVAVWVDTSMIRSDCENQSKRKWRRSNG
uniref:Uncharacterized protein n=1 Tax=Salix viminalis TaxID=40686 RepID=A0A6N2KYT9_SALVM